MLARAKLASCKLKTEVWSRKGYTTYRTPTIQTVITMMTIFSTVVKES